MCRALLLFSYDHNMEVKMKLNSANICNIHRHCYSDNCLYILQILETITASLVYQFKWNELFTFQIFQYIVLVKDKPFNSLFY